MNTSGVEKVRVVTFPVSLGRVKIFFLPEFLLRLELTSDTFEGSFEESSLNSPFPLWVVELKESLQAYFQGEKVTFKPPLFLKPFPSFFRKVYLTTREIPYGEVRSYGWVARKAGHPKAWRAVGQALKDNPFLLVVPCHRVVRSDGSLGGWSGSEGLKEKLLEIEGYLL